MSIKNPPEKRFCHASASFSTYIMYAITKTTDMSKLMTSMKKFGSAYDDMVSNLVDDSSKFIKDMHNEKKN